MKYTSFWQQCTTFVQAESQKKKPKVINIQDALSYNRNEERPRTLQKTPQNYGGVKQFRNETNEKTEGIFFSKADFSKKKKR